MKTHYYTQDIIDICTDKHLTVDEIFIYLQNKYPEIGKSSVYRNVEQMSEVWKLKKVVWIWKKAYFEANIWNHIHLIDQNTGQIIDLPIDAIDIKKLPENFQLDNIDVKIFWNFQNK